MAREFFKDLPDTTTPLTKDRLNGLLNGEEALGEIVVDSIRSKNMFDKSTIVAGDIINGYSTIRLSSRQALYLEAGTYTFSTNQSSTYQYGIQVQNVGVPPLSAYPTYIYDSGWQSASTKTFTISTAGYVTIAIRKADNTTLSLSNISSFNYQLEKGSTATNHMPYQELDANNLANKEVVVGNVRSKNILGTNNYASFTWQKNNSATTSFSNNRIVVTSNGSAYSGIFGHLFEYADIDENKTYTTSFMVYADNSMNLQYGISASPLSKSINTSPQVLSFTANGSDMIDKNVVFYCLTSAVRTITISNIQVEEGSSATNYMPYQNFGDKTIIMDESVTVTPNSTYVKSIKNCSCVKNGKIVQYFIDLETKATTGSVNYVNLLSNLQYKPLVTQNSFIFLANGGQALQNVPAWIQMDKNGSVWLKCNNAITDGWRMLITFTFPTN